MGELIDDDFFKKREQTIQQQVKGQRWLTVLVVIVLLIVVLGVLWWRMKNNPEMMIIDINRASVEQLQYLPDVGPVVAREIVKGRPYESVEDLKQVKGIGDKTLQKIRPRAKVE